MTRGLAHAGGSFALALLLLFMATACDQPVSSTTVEKTPIVDGARRIKLWVTEDGIYRLEAAELAAAGVDVPDSLTQETLRLGDGPHSVPFVIVDDALIFYGRASDDRYVPERPYILEVGQPGTMMSSASVPSIVSPQLDQVMLQVRLEENNEYVPEARHEDESDVWFWSKLPQQDYLTAEVKLPQVGDGSGTLSLNAWGFTENPEVDGDHDLAIMINDKPLDTVVWDGQVHHTETLSLPVGSLQKGVNRITVDNRPEGASFLDIVQVNWLDLAYKAPPVAVDDRLTFSSTEGLIELVGLSGEPLILDISDRDAPRRLEGWQFDGQRAAVPVEAGWTVAASGPRGYLAPRLAPLRESDLLSETNQADMIIVTTDDLAPALAPLLAARTAEGLRVKVAPLAEIYDTFGYGAPSPQSIRAFVTYAYENWQAPRPRYLLLVGDATSDYLGHLGPPPDNLVPSPMVAVQFSGETVSDARLADVDGDLSPDLAIGRWPVTTRKEVEGLVKRTLDYEQRPANERVIVATDGSEDSFSRIADHLIDTAAIPRQQVLQRHGPGAGEFGMMWQEGSWLAAYIGHGSIDRWGKEDIFNLEAVSDLNGEAVPIVVQLTCLTGLFSHPEQQSLAEGMLLHEMGPVEIVAASSLTLSAHQEPFAVEFLRQLQDTNTQRIGDAFLSAKQVLDIEAIDGLREISDTFSLFGDPSARIVRP